MLSRPRGWSYRENSDFSEILTRTLGALQLIGCGLGILQACLYRTRTFGSKRPGGVYSRRAPLSILIRRYTGKTLVSKKYDQNVPTRIENGRRGYPLRQGTFSTFGSWRHSGVCSPYTAIHCRHTGNTRTWEALTFGWVAFRLSRIEDPVGFVVRTSAFPAHRSDKPRNSGFSEILTRTLGALTLMAWGLGT